MVRPEGIEDSAEDDGVGLGVGDGRGSTGGDGVDVVLAVGEGKGRLAEIGFAGGLVDGLDEGAVLVVEKPDVGHGLAVGLQGTGHWRGGEGEVALHVEGDGGFFDGGNVEGCGVFATSGESGHGEGGEKKVFHKRFCF